jgi:hypothetical protein
MGVFDFLNDLGESKSNFNIRKTNKEEGEIAAYLEILQSRGLMMEKFKNEVLSLLLNQKIHKKTFDDNVTKSINVHENIEVTLTSVDESMFKFKDNRKEYIGTIDRLPEDSGKPNSDTGKISYELALSLFEHLKGKIINVKMLNSLCDALDCNIKSIYNMECLTEGVIKSKS